jgi:alanine dehydrogenase
MTKVISAKQINKNYDMAKIVKEIELAYKQLAKGRVNMPERQFIVTQNGADVLVAPAYLGDTEVFGIKISSYTPKNADKGLPILHGVIPLMESKTGKLIAILDAPAITALRTGAKTAVAAKYLARKNSEVLGILGMGTQARTHTEAVSKVRNIKKVIYWSRNPEKHRDLVKFARKNLKLEVEIATEPKDVALNCDILVEATWTEKPLVGESDIEQGTLVIGLNHLPSAVQFPQDLLNKARVYIDIKTNTHAGTIHEFFKKESNNPPMDLCDILTSKKDFSVRENEIVYFHSSGVSIEDVAGAYAVYRQLSR